MVESDLVLVPFIVIGELEYGLRNGSKYHSNRERLHLFLQGSNCRVIHSGSMTAESYGHIKSQLRNIGKPIPENDIWIAALAEESGAQLVSFDQYFKYISELDYQILQD